MPEIRPPLDIAKKHSATFPLIVGYIAAFLLIGGLGYWSATARIAGAVVAPGIVQVESNRQAIQHLDGGIVGAILVKDGDHVSAGDILIQFDDTRFQSELAIVEGQLFELQARTLRLDAEREDLATLNIPANLEGEAKTNPILARQIAGELNLLNARRTTLAQEAEQLEEQLKQFGFRIEGIEFQLKALREQQDYLEAELSKQQQLLDNGQALASRVLELHNEKSAQMGQVGKLTADIAEIHGQIAAVRVELLKLPANRREEAIAELSDIQNSEIELAQRRIVLLDTIAKLDVTTPVSGIVYESQVFALKSVVQAGEVIMHIIPQESPLIIATRVETIHIDQIHVGQIASLRFTAFDQRQSPELFGNVSLISADVIMDQATGASFYAVEILPKPEELDKLGDQEILPGMPVEAYVRTGDRSPLAYLTKPLTDYFNRAFRE